MTNLTRLWRTGSIRFAVLMLAAGAVVRAADCASCHGDQSTSLPKSAHTGLPCETCHDNHDVFPHPDSSTKPQCGSCHQDQAKDFEGSVHAEEQRKGNAAAPDCARCHGSAHELLKPKTEAFRKALPGQCGSCHKDAAAQFNASIHGQGVAEGVAQVPVCSDCHGSHAILRHTNSNSPVFRTHIRDTCGGCHGNVQLSRQMKMPEDRMVSFDESFHGLAAKAGNQTVANCASCHGVHNILPSSDAKSTIHASHLQTTCGQCHPGAGKKFAITQVHLTQKGESAGVVWVRRFYLIVIPLTIGFMLLHNGGDWLRKVIQLRSASRQEASVPVPEREPAVRMFPFERMLHAGTALSFTVLVWTGFALKYPDQWWAYPLMITEGSWPMRSVIHRIAAVVFLVACGGHVVSLIVSRKLREHWLELLPRFSDAREAVRTFVYNIGLSNVKPARSPHGYIEKAEYWAVVWGAMVMAVSGIILWANSLILARFSKTWLDVSTSVHFYEAVLAGLAIVVWHFYSAIFDPDVYPLDTAWLTGYTIRKVEEHAKGAEPDSLRDDRQIQEERRNSKKGEQ
jgi:cytochrome b subunit of formate dehydrogenase